MTVTIEIADEIIEQARKHGTTPEKFVLDAVREKLAHAAHELSNDEWTQLIKNIGAPAGVSLSDEAVSSESLYD